LSRPLSSYWLPQIIGAERPVVDRCTERFLALAARTSPERNCRRVDAEDVFRAMADLDKLAVRLLERQL
jgi:hypothetical protein